MADVRYEDIRRFNGIAAIGDFGQRRILKHLNNLSLTDVHVMPSKPTARNTLRWIADFPRGTKDLISGSGHHTIAGTLVEANVFALRGKFRLVLLIGGRHLQFIGNRTVANKTGTVHV